MRRREFITLLGGATAAWPLGARAQQSMRRVAIINVRLETDPQGQSQLKAFRQGFEKLGWDDGRNVKIDVRWAGRVNYELHPEPEATARYQPAKTSRRGGHKRCARYEPGNREGGSA